MGLLTKYRAFLIASSMLIVFFTQASVIALKKSNTWDESAHILAGYAYLKKGMDYLSPLNHPVAGRSITALLPAVLLDLEFNPSVKPEEAKGSNFFPYSIKFLYENKKSASTILFLSRMANILLGVLLGVYVYIWSRELWGERGGYLSLFFYCLSPNILAHSSLATTDIPVTAFFFISLYYIYGLAKYGITPIRVLSASVFISLALTSKHTGLLILPFAALPFVLNLRKGPAKAVISYLALITLVYIFIWAVYGFRYNSPGAEPLFWERFSGSPFSSVFGLLRKTRLLPESYLYGLSGVISGAGEGRAAFLMGEYSSTGWWYYFPLAFLIKTPVPTITLLAASVLFIAQRKEERGKAVFLLLPAILIFAVFMYQKVDIGLRHVLPAYPFLFTFIGFTALIQTPSMRAARVVFIGCLLWYVSSAVQIFPHDLAYFNEFAGGPGNGYKYLVDSNLDWGQDLPGLKKYMDENNVKKIKLAYFGLNDPGYFGIDYEYLPSFMILDPKGARAEVPLKGYFAISATMLQGVYLPDRDFYRVFRDIKPVADIGHSIFIYRLE